MIDFNRKLSPKCSEEIEFDKLNKQYEAKFGRPYVFYIGIDSGSWQEVLQDIRQRIENNEPREEPKYKKGLVY